MLLSVGLPLVMWAQVRAENAPQLCMDQNGKTVVLQPSSGTAGNAEAYPCPTPQVAAPTPTPAARLTSGPAIPLGSMQSGTQIASTYLGAESAYRSAAAKVPANQPYRRACYLAEASYYHALAMQLGPGYTGPVPQDPSTSSACEAMLSELATSPTPNSIDALGAQSAYPGSGITSANSYQQVLADLLPTGDASALARGILSQGTGFSTGTVNTIAGAGIILDVISNLFRSDPPLPTHFGYHLSSEERAARAAQAEKDFASVESRLDEARSAYQRAFLETITETSLAANAVKGQHVAK